MFSLKLSLLLVAVPLISARAPKILGGVDDDPSHYPYHVALLKVNQEDGSVHHFCGGAIIHRRYVLTAAHCVYNLKSKDLMVRTGGNQAPPKDKPHHERRAFRRVARIMYPKDFKKNDVIHERDIAMLKIRGTFDLADEENFKKVYLPVKGNDFEGKWVTISGYGSHDQNQRETKPEGEGFKSLRTKVIHNDECDDTKAWVHLTQANLCTESIQMKGHTCYGDGGNPLVFEDQVIGILNNPRHCDDSQPEIYTRVSEYLDFIKTVLEGRFSSGIVYQ